MRTSYGVVWRVGEEPLARGKLELLPRILRLDGVTGERPRAGRRLRRRAGGRDRRAHRAHREADARLEQRPRGAGGNHVLASVHDPDPNGRVGRRDVEVGLRAVVRVLVEQDPEKGEP